MRVSRAPLVRASCGSVGSRSCLQHCVEEQRGLRAMVGPRAFNQGNAAGETDAIASKDAIQQRSRGEHHLRFRFKKSSCSACSRRLHGCRGRSRR